MSKSAKIYAGAALVLVGLPLVFGLWSGSSAAIMAIALLGIGGYGFAVCLLVAGFWHRYRHGAWPVDVDDEPTGMRQKESRGGTSENRRLLYRANRVLLSWLNRHFSNV